MHTTHSKSKPQISEPKIGLRAPLVAINRLVTIPYFLLAIKLIASVVFLLLVITGLLAHSDDASFLYQLRNTNFGNLIVWSYWWPAIVIAAISLGRVWCMICPVELLTSMAAKFGVKGNRPGFVKSGWVIVLFYLFILLIGIQGFAIHRNPFYMAIYLLVISFVALIAGLVYKKNTFCRYICPVGFLLGFYAKLAPIGLRVKDPTLCKSCKDNSCIHPSHSFNLEMKSCGVEIYPGKQKDNADCILCAGCIKTCSHFQEKTPSETRPNPQLTWIGFAKSLFTSKPLKIAEALFVLLLSGFVVSEIWTEWNETSNVLRVISKTILAPLSIENSFIKSVLHGIIIFVLVPLVIWLIPFIITKLMGVSLKLKDYLKNYSLAFIPIIAAAHLLKAILKSVSRLPYFEFLHTDPIGMKTARKILEGKLIVASLPSVFDMIITFLLLIIVTVGLVVSIRMIVTINARIGTSAGNVYFLIPVLYGSIFFWMIIFWRF